MKEVTVCVGSSCHLKSSYQVVKTFESLIKEHALQDKLKLKASFVRENVREELPLHLTGNTCRM